MGSTRENDMTGARQQKIVSARNMIDYMMIDQRCRTAITETRNSIPSPSIGSDHSLVLGNIRIRFQAQVNKTARTRIDRDNQTSVRQRKSACSQKWILKA